MTGWGPLIGVALVSSAATALGTFALVQARAGDNVRAYLLDHPEVLQEASDKLRLKQAAAQIAPLRRDLETPYAQGYIGAKDGNVTLVQFFDYACGYCKAALADLQRLVREDPKVKVVFRELPILSRESEAAARVSLFAAERGRYGAFHQAMYDAGRPSAASIPAAARAAGLDTGQLQQALASPQAEREIAKNVELARALGFSGTPAWVVGEQLMSGAVGYDALKEAVAKARENRPAERPRFVTG
jgi:protein-disulfide isomerase